MSQAIESSQLRPKWGNSIMTQRRIDEKFYPLTPEVARKLREANLTAAEWRLWSYLVELEPFGDRYLELPDLITIMQECDMKKSTFYAAIAKLQALELFDFQYQGIFARNLAIPKNRKAVRKFGNDSENSETIPKIRKVVREIGNDSENSENQSPETLIHQASSSPQTLQNSQTNQTNQTEVGGGEKFFEGKQEVNGQREDEQIKEAGGLKQGQGFKEGNGLETSVSVEEKVSRAVIQKNTEVQQTTDIPQDLIDKLEELEIPLDSKVKAAIASHHISQAYGAARHVEDTWATINNPRAVFLYQLPKQPMEKAKQRFSPEFLDWYRQAVAEGVVEDIPPEWLPLDHYHEPKVRLSRPDPVTGAPYTLVEWRRLQREPDYDPNQNMASLASLTELLEQLKRGRKGDG